MVRMRGASATLVDPATPPLHSVVTDDARDERDMTDRACRHAFIDGFAGVGERVLVVAGVPFGTPGSTNNLRIAVVGPDGGTG